MGPLARRIGMLVALVGAFVFSCSGVGYLASSNSAGATTTECSSSELSLVPGISEVSAGNVGTPIVITNNGSVACAISGYPAVVAHIEGASPHPVTFVRGPRSEIYVASPVRTVVVGPKGDASFGISYVDGRNQEDGQGRDCLMSSVSVELPRTAPARKITVVFRKGTDGFGGPINSCFTGFEFGLTPIVKGPTPPEH
jgi:hypothetical protein